MTEQSSCNRNRKENDLGTCLLRFKNLDTSPKYGVIDSNIVEDLIEQYRHNGCNRDDPGNYISVRVDRSKMQGIAKCSQGIDELLPVTTLDHQFEIIHGHHRIVAARKFFDDDEEWWGARLYDEGMIASCYCSDDTWILMRKQAYRLSPKSR